MMFGFFKKKKTIDKFEYLIAAVISPYTIMRKLKLNALSEKGMTEFEAKCYEASYILGILDSCAQYVDPKMEILTQAEVIPFLMGTLRNLHSIEVEETKDMVKAVFALSETRPVFEIQMRGGQLVRDTLKSIQDDHENTGGGLAGMMNTDFLDDQALIEDFKSAFRAKLTISE